MNAMFHDKILVFIAQLNLSLCLLTVEICKIKVGVFIDILFK